MSKEIQPIRKGPEIKVSNVLPEEITPEQMAAALGAEVVGSTGSNNLHLPLIAATHIISEPDATILVEKLVLHDPTILKSGATGIPGIKNSQVDTVATEPKYSQEANDIFTLAYWHDLLQRFLKVK